MGKILELHQLVHELERLRSDGKKIVLCHGVFDLLHIGHIRYLRRAKELGDILAVTVTPDRFVDKGPTRPAFTEQLRLEAVASLDCTDYAALNAWPTAEETLRQLRPDIYAKGAEFKDLDDIAGKIALEAAVTEEIGCRLEFVHDITFSSSNLINRYLSNFSHVCREYLDLFRGRHTIEDLTRQIDSLKDLTVLLIGDAIIDEYHYCSPLGASSKDPVLALLYGNSEVFAGGAAAVANHMAKFAKKIIWCTVLGGGGDGQEEFIRSNLASNIEMHAITRPATPTVRKIRITDGYSFQKILEIYHMERKPLPEGVEVELRETTMRFLPQVNLTVAADFGNGCIMLPLAAELSARAPFLAVNTQANAGNRGYHTIGRYPKADFIQLAGHEINLEFRNSSLSPIEMMSELKKRLQAGYILLTEGREGCSVLDNLDLARAPSFAVSVVDRVGAGDAVFSLASLLAYRRASADVIAFLGNAAGSLAVGSIGNSKAVSSEALLKYITAILK
jgi:rfaE bifunctional protein nucleotidyltransferase chain/domain